MRTIPVAVLSLIGLVAGAIMLYLVSGIVYLHFFPGPVTNGAECARGMLLSYLSIFIGGFVGAVVGGYAAYKYNAPIETWQVEEKLTACHEVAEPQRGTKAS